MRNLIEFHEQYVKKIFIVTDLEEKEQIKSNFTRELNAYKKFAELNVNFVPKLLEYDYESLTLTIEKVNGLDLVDLLSQNEKEVSISNIKSIIDQIIRIDRFLYNNKLNVLQISPKDLIYDFEQDKIFLIDLEYTISNSNYKQILYDRMFHNRLLEIKNIEQSRLFLEALQIRKKEFKRYNYRKLKNLIVRSCRSFFPLHSKKEYKKTKINVSY